MDLKEEEILGDTIDRHWYYQSKAKAMRRMIGTPAPRHVLDIGSGSGFFSKYLLSHTEAEDALCVDISYAKDWDDRVGAKPIQFRRSCGAVAADVVLMMDVLEHVDDDVALVSEYAAKVPSGTHFLVTVPAFGFLWSSHDVFLEHRRRYTIAMLDATMRKAGMTVERMSYYFGFVFPLVAGVRLTGNLLKDKNEGPKSHMKKFSPVSNAVLSAACALELPLMPLNRLAGLSVFCLARKP